MRFILRRLGFFVVTLWAAVTLNFLIPRLMPGNAALAMMSRYKGRLQPQALHAIEIAFGINTHESLVHAYFTYLGNILRGRFGISLTFFPDTVTHQVLQALPWTLALVGTTTILAFILGTLIGLVSAWRRGGVLDGLLPPIFVITSAFPYFASNAVRKRAPTLTAPCCARRSPAWLRRVLVFVTSMLRMSERSRPSSTILIGGTRSPSA